MKKKVVLLLAAIMTTGAMESALAANNAAAKNTAASTNEITVYLNGEKLNFDAKPYIEKGTTRVPMRTIFENLGAKVDWNDAKRTVTAEKDSTKIELVIGKDTALVNGKESKLLVPAEIKDSRTMVPLRFVSEALGAKVDWDGDKNIITITGKDAESKKTSEDISGVYESKLTEEIGGTNVEYTYSVELKSDGTGMLHIQDDIAITWDNKALKTADGTAYEYTVKGDKLSVNMDGVISEFTKTNTSATANKAPQATETSATGKFDNDVPYEFEFSSGAGGWRTILRLEKDGTFKGSYSDSEMGESGEGYPYGSVYVCDFSGKFEDIKKMPDGTYTMKLSTVTQDKKEKEEWIEDGIRYVVSYPYGLEKGKDFVLYDPDTLTDGLSEEFLTWWPGRFDVDSEKKELGYYGIYNKETEYGFFAYSE